MMPTHNLQRLTLCVICLFALGLAPAFASAAPPADESTPIMPLDEVRIGMKGYGLTVFKGTEIEPFPVEVVSVVRNSSPGRGVIWIRCTDERMAHNGPVQGMSGSPIYLWDESGDHALGEGGRLIGAFAFGFALTKDPLVGVQPIEYMRQAGQRTHDDSPVLKRAAAPGDAQAASRQLQTLARLGQQHQVGPGTSFRLQAIQKLMTKAMGGDASTDEPTDGPPLPRAPEADGRVQRMMLPLNVGSSRLASAVSPLLEPMGLTPVASGEGLISGQPPVSIEADKAQLQPGSVLAVPLAFGDLDLSAAGTVTDVLDDGTVLGFGHPMFGQGPTALPMATGFVHFIVPRLNTSFKMAGSLQIQGTILQDEAAAVAGNGSRRFATAPVSVTVRMPNLEEHTYHYEVVHHPQLTPTIASMVSLQSLTAVHDLPTRSTLRLDGSIRFTGGRELELSTLIPDAGSTQMLMELVPPITTAMNNPYQMLEMEGMDLTLEVLPQIRLGSIVDARLDRAQVAPGETVGVTVWVQPYGGEIQTHRLSLTVPTGVDPGDYPVMISGASQYLNLLMTSRPHLTATTSVGDMFDMLQRILGVRRNAVYATLQLPEQGIAVHRQELPQLPSSRRAVIATPTSTVATPFMQTVDQTVKTDVAIEGQLGFTLRVRDPRADRAE